VRALKLIIAAAVVFTMAACTKVIICSAGDKIDTTNKKIVATDTIVTGSEKFIRIYYRDKQKE